MWEAGAVQNVLAPVCSSGTIALLVCYGMRAAREATLEDWIVWCMATAMTYGAYSRDGGSSNTPMFVWLVGVYCVRAFGTDCLAALKSAPVTAWFTTGSALAAGGLASASSSPWERILDAGPGALMWGGLTGVGTWCIYWSKIRSRELRGGKKGGRYDVDGRAALLDVRPRYLRPRELDRLGVVS